MKAVGWIVAVVVLALGLGIQNFNEHGGHEHHTQVAEANGLPAPSYGMWIVGVVLTAVGGGLVGYRIGTRRVG